jgi:hypothetical protein
MLWTPHQLLWGGGGVIGGGRHWLAATIAVDALVHGKEIGGASHDV